ncbi:glycosyltransferase family 2 protein [Paenibacillus sp. BIC5C1]|uniref:glycosyltransferase family 2 protein n=1 Tax=Paenibacillus sp. BIC5C1 TaxID=3078263 RepID=UPI0028EB6DA3|nr:glycosyltransferase family 2 protein [Paenibacillus sp. BIC5C1]
MKLLSICMIVKDEERVLERCLSSVQDLADEIIIVDTGSTDKTKEIAKKYTDKIYDFKWCNDFSKARNKSLLHATGKWILVMDADEYISEEEHQDWRNFLQTEELFPHLAYTLPVINFTGEKEYDDEITTAPVTRLFPNNVGITFERPIHEQLTRGLQGELYHKSISLHIYHTGYQVSRIVEKNKHERNMGIFNQMIADQELSSYDWYTLGNQHRYAKDELMAIECYEKALIDTQQNEAWYPHCLMGLVSLDYSQNQLKRSWELIEKYLIKYNEYPEYYTVKGIHYETLGFFQEAEQQYLRAIGIAEKRAQENREIWLIDPMYSFDSPVQQLIGLYFRLNDNQNAIYWMSKQLNKNNKNPGHLVKMMEWLTQNEDEESVIRFFEQLYTSPTDKEYLLLFKVSLVIGNRKLVSHYKNLVPTYTKLSLPDQLKLSAVNEDFAAMHVLLDNITTITGDEQLVVLQVIIATLLSNDCSLLDKLSEKIENEKIISVFKVIIRVIEQNEISDDMVIETDLFFAIARQLYLMQEFEIYDQVVNGLNNSDLINRLANYFYDVNRVELAMNYYSALLSRNELNGTSLENLGYYHANQDYRDDAFEFLNGALQDEPGKRHIYKSLIDMASNQFKKKIIADFERNFPDFNEISFVKEFFANELKMLKYTV